MCCSLPVNTFGVVYGPQSPAGKVLKECTVSLRQEEKEHQKELSKATQRTIYINECFKELVESNRAEKLFHREEIPVRKWEVPKMKQLRGIKDGENVIVSNRK